jgi:hypothetical protein
MTTPLLNCNFNQLFGLNNLAYGETHTERASCKALMDSGINQPEVKYLFMEAFPEQLQGELDQYHTSPSPALPEDLRNKLLFQDVAYFASAEDGYSREDAYRMMAAEPRPAIVDRWIEKELGHNYNRTRLVEVAKRNGIRVIAIDSMDLRHLDGQERVIAMNDFAIRKIQETVSQAPGRYVIAAGKRHVTKSYSIDGFKERLGVVAINVTQFEELQGIGRPTPQYAASDCGVPDFLMVVNPKSTNTDYLASLPEEGCLAKFFRAIRSIASAILAAIARIFVCWKMPDR